MALRRAANVLPPEKKWKKGEILLIQILQYFANLEKERKRWDREKVGMDDRRG